MHQGPGRAVYYSTMATGLSRSIWSVPNMMMLRELECGMASDSAARLRPSGQLSSRSASGARSGMRAAGDAMKSLTTASALRGRMFSLSCDLHYRSTTAGAQQG